MATTSKLASTAAFWANFNLSSVQASMDDVAGQITTRQDDSEASRKRLIEAVKDFKTSKAETVRVEASPLIKAFQVEVDNLSKRSKAAEKAFFDVYKLLADALDPTSALETAVEAQSKDIEVKQLKETLDDYNKEMKAAKVKEKRLAELQAKVDAYDKNIDLTLNERIKDVETNMLEEFNAKLAAIEQQKVEQTRRADDFEAKLDLARRQLQEAKADVFELEASKEDSSEAKARETQLMLDDLEKATQRAVEAEKEAEALKEQLDVLRTAQKDEITSNATAENAAQDDLLGRQLEAKDREVQQLLKDLQNFKAERQKAEAEKDQLLTTVQTNLEAGEKRILALED